MRAWILRQPGGPEAFELTDIPRPEPQPGHVLIEVRAFGLNRSEWFTRIGESPTVQLPRVLGIECVGTVVRAPGGELEEGQRVAAMMGGMGREFDGSYAEYTSVPAANVFPLETELPWDVVGALPEMTRRPAAFAMASVVSPIDDVPPRMRSVSPGSTPSPVCSDP